MMAWFRLVLASIGYLSITRAQNKITDVRQAWGALNEYNSQAEIARSKFIESEWAVQTNITDYNEKKRSEQNLQYDKFTKEAARKMSRFDLSAMPKSVQREMNKIMDIGISAQNDTTKLKRLSKLLSDMQRIHSTAKVCLSKSECLSSEPGLMNLFANSRDHDRLLKAWEGYRDATGKKMKDQFTEYVTLHNEAIRLAGYPDTGAYWRNAYEMDGFETEIQNLFEQVRPLFEHFHAFVRRKLKAIYGADKFPQSGHIPDHFLGNMWTNLAEDIVPFKNKKSMGLTDQLKKQGYDAIRIFETANDFFTSLGMMPMPRAFWDHSMLVKPKDGRKVVCHGGAWDFFNRKDFRIKMCTQPTKEYFGIAHHEMGHIEYMLQYKDLPVVFRDGANAGFHEAVGDTISLSVSTPEHLHKIGLLGTFDDDNETDINFLMNMALETVAFMPFGYLVDQWRWSVFRGDTKPDDYTKHWWDLRCKYEGVSFPVKRSKSDFDPGSLYHVPNNVPYIRYFVSKILQFQFHKAACQVAGNRRPLHRCSIYGSKFAGRALSNMLSLGASKPWPDALQQLTGQRKMSVQPLMEYFGPLLEFLKKENGDDVGWKAECSPISFGTIVFPSIPLTTSVIMWCLFKHYLF